MYTTITTCNSQQSFQVGVIGSIPDINKIAPTL